mmetsp:Transcript_104262/g.185289  ORF Transcript_104262/g.185289 Transcript_104262/m.185289 type:complete len:537 (-) Transcript_104262:103-1713(-)
MRLLFLPIFGIFQWPIVSCQTECENCHVSGAGLMQAKMKVLSQETSSDENDGLLGRILSTSAPALIIVDAMRQFQETYSLDTYVLPSMEKVIAAFNTAGLPIYTKLWFETGQSTAAGRFYGWFHGSQVFQDEDTDLAEPLTSLLDEDISKNEPDKMPIPSLECETCNRKYVSGYFSSLYPKMLQELAEANVSTLFLIGGWTEHCISATALDAKFQGFDVVLVPDGIAGSSRLFSKSIRMLQSFGIATLAMPGEVHAQERSHLSIEDKGDGAETSEKADGWTALDAVFESHWDLRSYWLSSGPWQGFVLPRLASRKMALVVVEEPGAQAPSSIDLLRADFTNRGFPIYPVDPSGQLALSDSLRLITHRGSVDTLVFVGNVSSGKLVHLCYKSFDNQFDVILVEDAIHSAPRDLEMSDLLEVMRHSVAKVVGADEVLSSWTGTIGYATQQGGCLQAPLRMMVPADDLLSCKKRCSEMRTCKSGQWLPPSLTFASGGHTSGCHIFEDIPEFPNSTTGEPCQHFAKALTDGHMNPLQKSV